jgi:hypothetical protein
MEELLISNVAETRGMLNRFLIEWDASKPKLASCADVESVGTRLTEHIADGKHKSNSAGLWVASIASVVAAGAAIVAWIKR